MRRINGLGLVAMISSIALLSGCGPIHSGKYLNGQPVSAETASKQAMRERIVVVPEQRGLKIVLASDRLFTEKTAHFAPKYQQTMQEVVRIMKEHPGQQITISSHTDNIGSYAQRKRLSRDQAETIAAYLWAHGVAPWTELHIRGDGATRAIASNSSLAGSQLNRRIEIELQPKQEG